MAMYDDMDMMYFNSPIISKAVNLYVDEVIQADSNTAPIGVEASSEELRDLIGEFLTTIDIAKYLRAIVFDIVLYGDACLLPTLSEDGIVEIVQVSPRDLQTRLEFTSSEMEKKISGILSQKCIHYT